MAELRKQIANAAQDIRSLEISQANISSGLRGVIKAQRDVRLRCLATYHKQTSKNRSPEQQVELDEEIIQPGCCAAHDGNIVLDVNFLERKEDRETFLAIYGIPGDVFQAKHYMYGELYPIFNGRATIKLAVAEKTERGHSFTPVNKELEDTFRVIRNMASALRNKGKDLDLVLADPTTPLGAAKARFENLLSAEKANLEMTDGL